MGTLLTLVLPALLPAVTDGLRGLFTRFTHGAGAQPANVNEAIQLMQAQTERVRALAELDKLAPNASAWVADLRGSFRYLAVGGIELAAIGAVIASGAGVEFSDAALLTLLELAGASLSFIIGDRVYLGLKR